MTDIVMAVHLLLAVDRIEPPWVVVEWADSGAFSDIAQAAMPPDVREGDRWILHIETDPSGKTTRLADGHSLRSVSGTIHIPEDVQLPPGAPYRIRFERAP